MEHVIEIAVIVGIILGLAWAIRGTETSRLRNALDLATKQATEARAQLDLAHRTLAVYDDAMARRDHELRVAGQKLAESERRRALSEAGELAADTEVQRLQNEVAALAEELALHGITEVRGSESLPAAVSEALFGAEGQLS